MCGFCHAPEHAYEVLLEDASLSRDGLCPEAQERLRMAATPLPGRSFDDAGAGLQYEWDEERHAWTPLRDWGHCTVCVGRTWKRPDDPRPHCCSSCSKKARLVAYALAHELGLVPPDVAETIAAELPDRRGIRARGWLRFSDYEVRDTRDFEGQPGPRTYQQRPIPRPPFVPGERDDASMEDA